MMNKYLISGSESLILSLCKEIEFIKNRSKNINNSLKTCQNESLSKRLRLELNKLNKKRLNIINASEHMFNNNQQGLSYEFLLEISKRTNCICN